MSTVSSRTCYDVATMDSPTDKRFGDWLQAELARREWSYAAFARTISSSDASVKAWIRGERNISEIYCDRIADVFGISRNFVRDLAGRPPTDEDPVMRSEDLDIPDWFLEHPPTSEEWESLRIYLEVHRRRKGSGQ